MQSVQRNFALRLLFILMISVSISCTKKRADDTSFKLTLPPHPNVSAKSVNASATSQPGKFCYIVQLRGSGLNDQAKTCYPNMGLSTEPLPPLATVQIMVPRGTGRIVELFGYIPKDEETCVTAPRKWQDLPLNRLFQMGRVENVDTDKDEVNVNLTIVFPGLHQHMGITTQAASNCYADLPPVLLEPDSGTPNPIQNGTQYSLRGHPSSGTMSKVLSGTHYQVRQGAIGVVR